MKKLVLGLCTLAILAETTVLRGQGTAFTYQGHLSAGGSPASGNYDLTFTIYDSANEPGNVIAAPLTNSATAVNNGLFLVDLDFGGEVFTGPPRWLQIGVRTNGGGAFTALNPRQPLLAVPYAILANAASNVLGNIPASQLSGAIAAARLPLASASALGVVQGDGSTITVNSSGIESVTGAALTGVAAALATNLASGATITNIYPNKWVNVNYTVTTNDRVIFSNATTNTTITLPTAPTAGIMFTLFNKGTGLVTINSGSDIITIPGIGTSSSAILGGWSSTSNTITVTFDGTNY